MPVSSDQIGAALSAGQWHVIGEQEHTGAFWHLNVSALVMNHLRELCAANHAWIMQRRVPARRSTPKLASFQLMVWIRTPESILSMNGVRRAKSR